jgi:hypothetical protein
MTSYRNQYNDVIDLSSIEPSEYLKILQDEDNLLNHANIYNPHDYDVLVEDFRANQDIYIPNNEIIKYTSIYGDFEPTFYQLEWHKFLMQRDPDGRLLKNLAASVPIHRRAGKSVGVLKTLILPRMLEEVGHYMHVFPTLKQGRDAIWNGLGRTTRDPNKQAIPYIELIPKCLWAKKNNHDMSITLINGSKYQIGGARGIDGTANHFRGFNVVGLVADEYAEWQPGIMSEIFTPMFLQNGGWYFEVFTPKGENHAYDEFKAYEEFMLQGNKHFFAKAYGIDKTNYNDGTPVIPEHLIELERKKGVPEDKIRQEYYVDFKALPDGLFYRDALKRVEVEGRVQIVKYNPNYPVYTAWDIGVVDDNVCLMFQAYNGFYRIFKVVSKPNSSLGEMMDIVNAIAPVEIHYMPHDTSRNMDLVDATQSRLVRLEEVKKIKNIEIIPKPSLVYEGICLARDFMSRCLFDTVEAAPLIRAFKNYKKKRDLANNIFLNEPVKSEYNHLCDTFRYAAIVEALGKIEMGSSVFTPFFNNPNISTRRRANQDDDQCYEFRIDGIVG